MKIEKKTEKNQLFLDEQSSKFEKMEKVDDIDFRFKFKFKILNSMKSNKELDDRFNDVINYTQEALKKFENETFFAFSTNIDKKIGKIDEKLQNYSDFHNQNFEQEKKHIDEFYQTRLNVRI